MITENGKYGFANDKGKIIIHPIYKSAFSFFEDKAKVSNDCTDNIDEEHIKWNMKSWFYIDKKGNKIN